MDKEISKSLFFNRRNKNESFSDFLYDNYYLAKNEFKWKLTSRKIKEIECFLAKNSTESIKICLIFNTDINSSKKPNTYHIVEEKVLYLPPDKTTFNFNCIIDKVVCFDIYQETDYIISNAYPIICYSYLFLPEVKSLLPQYISSQGILEKFVGQILRIKKNFVLGYNSKGASSSLNHLHFQFFCWNHDELIKSSIVFNLIDKINKEKTEKIVTVIENNFFMKSTIKYDVFEIEEYSILGISKILKIDSSVISLKQNNKCLINYILFEFDKSIMDLDFEINNEVNSSFIKEISICVFNVINKLNLLLIPYNLIANENKIIIFPRKYDFELKLCIGILELAGVYGCYSEEELEITGDDLMETFSEISIDLNQILGLIV